MMITGPEYPHARGDARARRRRGADRPESPILAAALRYAARGWLVFPCWEITLDGTDCACPRSHPSRDSQGHCGSPGKHPRTPNGVKDATTDVTMITTWWTRWPRAHIAIAAGASGLLVVDVDPRNGGDATLAELQATYGPLPETPRQLTGGGGWHIVLRRPDRPHVRGPKNGLGQGIDVKCDGGYIIVAPSGHLLGDYVWEIGFEFDELPIADAPAWLLERLDTRARHDSPPTNTPVREGLLGAALEAADCLDRPLGLDRCACRCPQEEQHTTGTRFNGSTVVYAPSKPGMLGGFHCSHGHCTALDARAVLDALPSTAVIAGRAALRARGIRIHEPRPAEDVPFPSDEDAPPQERAAEPDRDPGSEPTDDRTPWARALSAPAYCAVVEKHLEWLVPNLLMPGAVTRLSAPKGLGKSNIAFGAMVQLARAGVRILLCDRDNPNAIIRARLWAWGADVLECIDVLGREDAPPLTNHREWKSFPLDTYSLVIIDSWDSFTEGVGEQDSAKPSLAQKVLLDLAHRRNGPAILVPANTTKSGEAGRGSGTLEDREDIVCEVRDATNVTFSGREDWWAETATGSRAEWAEQARRRQHQQRLRLAFVYSKFRPGETPTPVAYEIDFTTTPWSYRDVTADIIAEGKAAAEATKQQAADQAATAMTHLRQEVERRAEAREDPYNKTTAAKFLTTLGLTWKRAHDAVTEGIGTHWYLEERHSERGKPIVLVPVNSSPRVPNNPAQKAPAAQGVQSHLFGTCPSGASVPNRPREKPWAPTGFGDDDLEHGRKLGPAEVSVEDVLRVFPGARIVEDPST